MLEYARNNVLCIGSLDVPKRPFSDCDLELLNITLSEAVGKFNEARAILIAEPQDKMGAVRGYLTTLEAPAKTYGLSFFAIVNNRVHRYVLGNLWDELQMGDKGRIYLPDALGQAAHDIFVADPGPPLGNAKILTPGFQLSANKRQLLRRVFYDCDRVYLRSLEGGKNSLNVFSVDAWLKRSDVGPRPLPFFIKIADPQTVRDELANYREYAEFFIPYHLRPNLDRKRCVSTESLSSIVGNLVEDSQSLRSVLRSNPGPGIIFSLFENSLKGFRLQPPDSHRVYEGSLEGFIKNRTRAKEVPKQVIERARRLRLTLSPLELETALCNAVKDVKCKLGPYHGDLHCGNVMVRGKDAILIDFSSASNDGPIAADPAAIEVSLIFGTDSFDKVNELSSWKQLVNKIYYRELHHRPPMAEKVPGPHSWLRRAVREIRHISLGCDCPLNEKSAVYAAYLIRFARLPVEQSDNPKLKKIAIERHAYALVIAERIVQHLLTSTKKTSP